jgi:flagellar M-ring protein FliF
MNFIKNIPENWKGLSSAKKSAIIVIFVCLFLSAVFFFYSSTRIKYAPLYTNMDINDAAKVVEGLKEISIPYTISDSGTTILIPEDQIYEVRLNLASKGLTVNSNKGFEVFDKSDLGATDFERNINYQRALQEELRRTILHIESIKQARVHLVLPVRSAFIENQHKPQASIVLELKPLHNLDPVQIKGIAELVAGSVENLSAEDVNIIDTTGRVLSDLLKDENNDQIKNFADRRTFEESLETRIQRLLENIYGPNKVATMVTADLDFNQKETSSIVWEDEGVVVSEQTTQRIVTTDNNAGIVGDPITDIANVPESSQTSEISSTKNYEVSQIVEKEILAPGRIKSISVAVAINGDIPIEKEAVIKDIVSAAIGYNAERGDTISVTSTTFNTNDEVEKMIAEMEKQEAAAQKQEQQERLIMYGLIGAAILAVFIITLLAIRKKPQEQVEEFVQTTRDTSPLDEVIPISQIKKESFADEYEKVKDIIDNDPEVAVQIINSWLEEGGKRE